MDGIIRCSVWVAEPSISHCGQMQVGLLRSFVAAQLQHNLKRGVTFSSPNSLMSLMRPEVRSSASSACTFFIDIWTSSLMCSMPTTLPLGPVYKQKNAAIALSHLLHFMPTSVKISSQKYVNGKKSVKFKKYLPSWQSRQWDIHSLNPHRVPMPLQLVCHLIAPKHEHAVKPDPWKKTFSPSWIYKWIKFHLNTSAYISKPFSVSFSPCVVHWWSPCSLWLENIRESRQSSFTLTLCIHSNTLYTYWWLVCACVKKKWLQ